MSEPAGRVTARTAALSPLQGGARAVAVVNRITEAIALGLITEGEQLPSETDLSAQLGVSTVTLREALSTLREQGLVETKRGRHGGSFIRVPRDTAGSFLRPRLAAFSVSELRDAGDEHAAIAGAGARLAAARATTDNVRRLLSLATRVADATGVSGRTRADTRFHIEVAVASQSERITRAEVSLQAELGALIWIPGSRDVEPAAAAQEHVAIAQAIAREDGALARQLAEKHVRDNLDRVIEARIASMTRR